jgi:hypothetical protein
LGTQAKYPWFSRAAILCATLIKQPERGPKRICPIISNPQLIPPEMLLKKCMEGVDVFRKPVQAVGDGVALVLDVKGKVFEVVLAIKEGLDPFDGGCETAVKDDGERLGGLLFEVKFSGVHKQEWSADSRGDGMGQLIGYSGWFSQKLKINTLNERLLGTWGRQGSKNVFRKGGAVCVIGRH